MPIQTPQWTDFLICPICCNEFDCMHVPVSLGCGHTLCRSCLSNLHRKQCPYDQTTITIDISDLPTNYALLQLVSSSGYNQVEKNQVLSELQRNTQLLPEDFHLYTKSLKHIEDIALFLKPFSSAVNSSVTVNVLSRPMQRKLVMLINCQLLEEEGRLRALKSARSLGERTVTELIIQHQNPQQLSTNLWAAVRARGCQFLGPAMQEEVLKLVLLALEDGSALSRKVLVMFVVQRLEPHFPQASKTSIGHVVQLLYRASCFMVSKREGDSSLMKLKEEFRTYDTLRREHDAQIVEIATEAGLRIAPDQWSALLYGDTAHKSHMQSIIDKLQNPQSFVQSVQELIIALQRTGDPGNLGILRPHLEYLADIDVNHDFDTRMWIAVFTSLEAAVTVVSGLVNFIKTHGCRKTNAETSNNITVHASKYKISLCRDLTTNGICPRGINCTFAHSEEELIKYRSKHRKYHLKDGETAIYSKVGNHNNINFVSPGQHADVQLEDSTHMSTKNMDPSKMNCFFCTPHNYAAEYSDSTFVPFGETMYPSRIITSPSLTSSATHKVSSSQHLVAVNQRKQQIISELQQVLSDVQNQHPEQYNPDIGQSSILYSTDDNSIPSSTYFVNSFLPTGKVKSIGNYNSPQSSVLFLPTVPADKTNVTFSNNIPDWNFGRPQNLTFYGNENAETSTTKVPLYISNDEDWNVNSGLCHSCGNSPFVGEDVRDANRDGLTNDVHESLLMESAKLQDQLRGLKKQIMDIKVKTYEDGIVNDLKALELRLECELAEEEKKLWPSSAE